MTHLFNQGGFSLHSGAKSAWKIDCDALTDDDIKTLVQMVRFLVRPFASVEGVPQGGLRLASALQPYVSLCGSHLIVDDVLTTGTSMNQLREQRQDEYRERGIVGVAIFARGQCPPWITPLFQMPEAFWTKPRTRSAL